MIYTECVDRYIQLSENERYSIFRDENGVFHKPSLNKKFNKIEEYEDDGNHILLSQANEFITFFLMYGVDVHKCSNGNREDLFNCVIDDEPIEVVLNTQGNNGSCLSSSAAKTLLYSNHSYIDPSNREPIDVKFPFFKLPKEYIEFIQKYTGVDKELEAMRVDQRVSTSVLHCDYVAFADVTQV